MRVITLVAFVVALSGTLAGTANADDGTRRAIRPPSSVLRHIDTEELVASPAPDTSQRQLVLLVGGYQSCSCIDDGTFDALTRRLVAAGFDVKRFGRDPDYPYDTFGPIDASATSLRDEVRHLAPRYAGVHIVTHSMGGVVADRAFAKGLSADDGVLTYVSWSAPHSGSTAAVAAEVLGLAPDSAAARDLASARPIPAPVGVVRLDLREATDALVIDRDARDPGVESRVLGAALEGHGGILTDSAAIDATVATIATRRIPPDTRSRALVDAVDAKSRTVSSLALLVICLLAVTVCVGALCLRGPLRPVATVLDRFTPRATRRRCA